MKPRPARALRIAAIVLAALVAVGSLGFYAWTRVARYPATAAAVATARPELSARGWYVFKPAAPPTVGVIFYPGGLVDAAAYAPLMQRLSDRGMLAVIVPMPLELAVFGVNRADGVIDAYPKVRRWIVGGHSLGGAMAAEYAHGHTDKVAGLALLAAYPAESTDMSKDPLAVVSVFGSNDGVAGDVFEGSLKRLPPDAKLIEIEGGNHARFGEYGPQAGDGTATIPAGEQQRRTADAISQLAEGLR